MSPREPARVDERSYAALHELATALMRRERAAQTMQPTALVHEVWLRLRHSDNAFDGDTRRLLGVAGWVMRRVLVDHARERARRPRALASEEPRADPADAESELVVRVDAALAQLQERDADLARIVELRFFAGASIAEVAATLGMSERTAKRRWQFARAWLHDRLEQEP